MIIFFYRSNFWGELDGRTLNLSVEVETGSLAVAMAVCSGLKGGLSQAKASCVIKPNVAGELMISVVFVRFKWNISCKHWWKCWEICSIFQIELTSPLDCDIKVELDVSGVYCKVAEGGSPAAELSSKFHHWGTCFYLGLIIAKVSKDAQQFSSEAENMQYE